MRERLGRRTDERGTHYCVVCREYRAWIEKHRGLVFNSYLVLMFKEWFSFRHHVFTFFVFLFHCFFFYRLCFWQVTCLYKLWTVGTWNLKSFNINPSYCNLIVLSLFLTRRIYILFCWQTAYITLLFSLFLYPSSGMMCQMCLWMCFFCLFLFIQKKW